MDPILMGQVLAADAAYARVFSRVVERDWGLLSWNPDNPGHWDANTARQVRGRPGTAGRIADEVISFYQARGLTPRIRLDDLSTPPDLEAVLRARGFSADEQRLEVMTWTGMPPAPGPLPPGVSVTLATAAELEALTRIHAEGFGYESDDAWIRGHLRLELGHPGVQHYLVRADGEPAACATVIRVTGWGQVESVATRPALRGRGLATALTQRVLADAAGPLFLFVSEANARRIYARAGFSGRGEVRIITCRLGASDAPTGPAHAGSAGSE